MMKTRNQVRLPFKIPLLILVSVTMLSLATTASSDQSMQVSLVRGPVFVGSSQQGPWQALADEMTVVEGQFVKTGDGSLVELTAPAHSVLRLSSNTILKIDRALFPESGATKLSTRLVIGRLWAKINRSIRKRHGLFDTRITTAVIGVRGTVFNVDAAADQSADIYVHEGAVGVGPPLFEREAAKEEMSWPVEVTEAKWEEIIVSQLQRLHIGADGIPGSPEAFDPEKEKDDWTRWNQERDALKQ